MHKIILEIDEYGRIDKSTIDGETINFVNLFINYNRVTIKKEITLLINKVNYKNRINQAEILAKAGFDVHLENFSG